MAGLLSARFRAGMRPLAIGTAITVAFSAPLADLLLEHHDLARRAGLHATELAGRLAQLGRDRGSIAGDRAALLATVARVQEDRDAAEVTRVEVAAPSSEILFRTDPARAPRAWPMVWNEAPLPLAEGVGRVRIAVGEPEWLSRDLWLFGGFGLLGLLLGLALYLFPLRLFREEDLVRLFARRSIRAAEEERLRLSRDLHDGVGQTLGAAAIAIARLAARTAGAAETQEATRLLDNALEELRRVSRGLRPPALDDLGLSAAIAGLAREAESHGLSTSTQIAELPRFAPEVELTCFRIAQEALANVLRHARATRVDLALRREAGQLILTVADDGVGLGAPAGIPPTDAGGDRRRGPGLGLVGARERAAQLFGAVTVESSPEGGTRLMAVVPC